ncbi:MAG: FeoB-associated Cys-rich membrane protein [Clostridiales Family XIII bacterium]|nr:FeoB-associated Cys-rich membrane protein [Clostridiales Family XIII bacterium]
MGFFHEYGSTIAVAAVLAIIVAIIIIGMARRVKKGGCATGCDCCSGSCGADDSRCSADNHTLPLPTTDDPGPR